MENQPDKTNNHKKYIKILWGLLVLGVLALASVFIILSFSNLPGFEELEDPRSDEATQIFADDGSLLGRFYIENRVPITFNQLSPELVEALIATEDERYMQHCGIDFKGLARAVIKTGILQDNSGGGASTITQQLAKLLFTGTPGSGFERVVQKLKEWIIAVRLERQYTKAEIMAMYLNKFNFIYGAYGIKAASEIYFGKSQEKLNTNEAAMLVGMLKNPALYNPIKFPNKAIKRREVVLKQMVKNEQLDMAAYDSLRVLPLEMNQFKTVSHDEGSATYFRMELAKDVKELLKRDDKKRSDGSEYDIYRDGLKIYTTIDPVIQNIAETAVVDHMSSLQKTFFKHWDNLDPWDYSDYETSEQYKKVRAATLNRLIWNSDRAIAIQDKLLGETIEKMSELSEWDVRQADIARMLEQEKNPGHFKDLKDKKYIGKKLENIYTKIMSSPEWKVFRKKYAQVEKEIDTAFDKPAKMQIFAYNDKGYVDTSMTPLDSIKYLTSHLQAGVLAVDPITGYVKAWVGGTNHRQFKYDHIRSNRQVGSTFKPFIYATAIAQQGVSPCFQVDDIPYTIHVGESSFDVIKDWTPQNSDGEYTRQQYTLFKALEQSKNTVSVFLMKQLGDVSPVLELIRNLGIPDGKVPRQPSICLGASDLSVMDMTGSYTAFANNGVYTKPIYIKRIEDKNGRLIYSEEEDRIQRQAMSPKSNYVMVQMLKKVTHNGKPGFYKVKTEFGGKTGTTNNHVDGWFMGITPNLVVGTWVGGEHQWIRFRNLALGQGARMARPIFSKILNGVEQDSTLGFDTNARFPVPPGDLGIVINCDEYVQNASGSSNIEEEESLFKQIFGDSSDSTSTDENEDFF